MSAALSLPNRCATIEITQWQVFAISSTMFALNGWRSKAYSKSWYHSLIPSHAIRTLHPSHSLSNDRLLWKYFLSNQICKLYLLNKYIKGNYEVSFLWNRMNRISSWKAELLRHVCTTLRTTNDKKGRCCIRKPVWNAHIFT